MSYQKHNFTPGAVLLASQLNDMDNEIEALSQGETVLSDDFKTALLNCFENVAWINENGQTYYDALYDSLYPDNMWFITNILTGCATSNNATNILKNNSYVATITANEGYTLDGATVSVTMGGNDVTNLYYSSGSINIPNVTGDLVITVTAISAVESITAVFTQGSAVIYDTDSLDTLKQYLTVTATFSDSTTATVTDYTLSGTLTAGTSTITVSYGGKTDTFNVTVTRLEIKVFRGKGVSGTSIVDNAKRALSEPVAFTNVAPITINWPSLSAFRLGFKNTTTNVNTIDTTNVSIAPIAYLNQPRPSSDVFILEGWLLRVGEEFLTDTHHVGETLTPTTFSQTSGYVRLLFADISDLSNPLPSESINSVFYINGIPYHLVETPVSEFE